MPLSPIIPFDSRSFELGNAMFLRLDLDSVSVPIVGAIDLCLPLMQAIPLPHRKIPRASMPEHQVLNGKTR